jgi:hypothetical protein
MWAAGLLLTAAAGMAGEKKDKDQAPEADKPGLEHRQLARLAGEYTTVSKFRLKPDDAPMESKGTARLTSVLDGRFLLEENTGTQFGQPYKGLRLVGYNNATKQYEASWTYSLSNGMMTLTGTGKDEGKVIEWTAHFMNEKGAKQSLYVITRQLDVDHFVVELFGKTPEGEKGPAVETTYTRKKMEKP